VGNIVLYHLQRHSDHHAHPARRYQALRHFDEAPQLPGGYAAMVTAAYIPPLWFALMDHRVVRHYGGNLDRINMHPSAQARLLQRWSPAG
jgi:alkane 1-monooxygenase